MPGLLRSHLASARIAHAGPSARTARVALLACILLALAHPWAVAQEPTNQRDGQAADQLDAGPDPGPDPGLDPSAPAPGLALIRGAGLRIDSVRWGWSGNDMPIERHAPVVVTLTGDRPVEGMIVLEYTQDMSQRVRVVAPFAITPGRPASVELAACLHSRTERITLTVQTRAGEARLVYDQVGVGDELPMPMLDRGSLSVASVDVREASALVSRGPLLGEPTFIGSEWRQRQEAREALWESVQVRPVQPRDLPTAWIAYESLDLLVVSDAALAQTPPTPLEAMLAWVRSGGRLLVRVRGQTNDWKRPLATLLMPEVLDAIGVEEQSGHVMEASLHQSVLEAFALDRTLGPDKDARTSVAPAWNPGPVPLRPITLGPPAQHAGWRIEWPLSPSLPAGALASGPAGLGMVAILTVNPARVPAQLDANSERALWRLAAESVIPTRTKRERVNIDRDRFASPWWPQASGATRSEQSAIDSSLNAVTHVQALSTWFFTFTAVVVAVLALLIGPIGRFVLRRRGGVGALSSSWKSALVLIALASLLGWIAPRLLRSGQSAIVRVTLHDHGPAGNAIARTGVVGAFAAARQRSDIASGAGSPEERSQGRWWRGVAPASGGGRAGGIGEPLTLLLPPGGTGALRTARLAPVDSAQWTYRAALWQEPAGPSGQEPDGPRAQIDWQPADQPSALARVRVDNAPQGAMLRGGQLWIDSRALVVHPEQPAPDQSHAGPQTALVHADTISTSVSISQWLFADPDDQEHRPAFNVDPWPSRAASSLPLASERSDAMLRLLETGEWALLVLEVWSDRAPTKGSREADEEYRALDVVRMLVPIEASARARINAMPATGPVGPPAPAPGDPDPSPLPVPTNQMPPPDPTP